MYYPIANMIWSPDGWMAKLGVLDFAGGIVIHTTSGVSAIVCALSLGRRVGFDEHHGEFQPSNLPLAAIGTSLLWAGWFGYVAAPWLPLCQVISYRGVWKGMTKRSGL